MKKEKGKRIIRKRLTDERLEEISGGKKVITKYKQKWIVRYEKSYFGGKWMDIGVEIKWQKWLIRINNRIYTSSQ